MTSKFSNKYLIPEQFPKILHDYAREVVRYMPEDIFDFSIQYFYSLEKGLKLNYIQGGSKDIPKISENNKLNNNSDLNISISTNPNTQNMFYSNNVTKENNNKEKKEILTPINSDESRNSKLSAVTNGSGIVSLSKNFVNKICEQSQRIVRELKKNDLYNIENDNNKLNRTGDTFSNISGDDNDKTGVRNFVGNIMGDALKTALETLGKKGN